MSAGACTASPRSPASATGMPTRRWQSSSGERTVTVFTKNTTESINMVAHGLPWKAGDRVVTTILEHHSNLLPWRDLKERGVEVDVIGIKSGLLARSRCA